MSVYDLDGNRIPTLDDRVGLGEVARWTVVMLMLCAALIAGVELGKTQEAELRLQAFEREEKWMSLLELSVSQNERALAYVMDVDEQLAREIATRFPTHPYVVAWREADR